MMTKDDVIELQNKIIKAADEGCFPSFVYVETDCGLRSSCRYRGEGNKRCVVGCLIPDEEYKSEYESKGVITVANRYQVPSLLKYDLSLLSDLQTIHDGLVGWRPDDNVFEVEKFKQRVIKTCNEYIMVN